MAYTNIHWHHKSWQQIEIFVFQIQHLKVYFKVEMEEVEVFHYHLQHLDLAGVRGSYRLSWTCCEKLFPTLFRVLEIASFYWPTVQYMV